MTANKSSASDAKATGGGDARLDTRIPARKSFSIGTGHSLFASTLIPAILAAKHEVILATCFWAPSLTLDYLSDALKRLSGQVIACGGTKVRVYILLSSRSLFQKLFHTSSSEGYLYPPSSWESKLGLPKPADLPGLELRVKSIFFRPFSVLHSKYLIVDRREIFMPSCNVSWEDWYECCLGLEGPVVGQVFDFWKSTWGADEASLPATLPERVLRPLGDPEPSVQLGPKFSYDLKQEAMSVEPKLLPHPHHASLKYSLWFIPNVSTPRTPLNDTLLRLFQEASTSITLVTPNFTCRPVYNALLQALQRGVDIRIITNRRMMILEQLLTAGSITEWWLWALVRSYKKLKIAYESTLHSPSPANDTFINASGSSTRLGSLHVQYFRPMHNVDPEAALPVASAASKIHIKLTVVDEVLVLGSGNMDCASWFTSQELGIMIGKAGDGLCNQISGPVLQGLEGMLEDYYIAE